MPLDLLLGGIMLAAAIALALYESNRTEKLDKERRQKRKFD